MAIDSPRVRRLFRFTVDVEATLDAAPDDASGRAQYRRALVRQLRAHPDALDRLLRSSALDALREAEKLVARQYGLDRISDQQLLRPIIEQLEPAARACFIEEVEAGVPVYYFDGYGATVKHVSMRELEQEQPAELEEGQDGAA